MTAVVRAAGGVPVRDGVAGREVIVIHRRRYDDWTLPKGKCHTGERDEDCALREVEEETGLACELLEELPWTEYIDPKGRLKRVRYWGMCVLAGEIRPVPPEVDDVRWVPAAEVFALLTHAHDVDVVAAALAPGQTRGV